MTKCAPHQAQKFVASGRLTFDKRVVLHRGVWLPLSCSTCRFRSFAYCRRTRTGPWFLDTGSSSLEWCSQKGHIRQKLLLLPFAGAELSRKFWIIMSLCAPKFVASEEETRLFLDWVYTRCWFWTNWFRISPRKKGSI